MKPDPPTRRLSRVAVALLVGLAAIAAASAAPDDPPQGTDEVEYRRDAERVAAGIELELAAGDKWVKVARVEKPLLYYSDPTRNNDRGSVWAWAGRGRPAAVLELYRGANFRPKWASAVCNTSGGKVRASLGGKPWWQENESATELGDVPGAPVPAADATQRQRQLKVIAQKFAGHEFWDPDNSRYELRRLDRPLHTYRDEDAGLLDGALYILANGTNPEILLFLEARAAPKGEGKPAWRYAVGRLAHAELHVEYDGKEVFTAPRADRAKLSGPNRPYWVTFVDAPPGK